MSDKKKKILVIEDDRAVAELLIHMFDEHGFEAEAAYNGIEGLERVKNTAPDLILLDIGIPLVDGWTLLETLKSSPKTSLIPVLMCTERSLMKEVEKAFSAGAAGYITKPFVVERVLAKVRETLAT